MPNGLTLSPMLAAATVFAAIGAVLVLAGIAALLRARPLQFVLRALSGTVLILLGSLAGTIVLGTQGYRALTHEEIAARISVHPEGPQRFRAVFVFADGSRAEFALKGDELYVDAHILKWTPLANLLGLHTAYELDRVSGRFRAIEQERAETRTVHPLGLDRSLDLFDLRRRHAFLAPLLDAEYGSATFVPADRPAEIELRVSTTGLLMREKDATR